MKPIIKRQPPPFTIKFELTEGCNLHCGFCGISSIRRKPGSFRFMTKDTAREVIKQLKELKWFPKLDCAMHGEPLMNPDSAEIFDMFREAFPKMYMYVTSNGGPLLRGKGATYNIDRLMESLNVIALDDYRYAKIVPRVLKDYKGNYAVKTYPDIQIYCRQKFTMKNILIFPDISVNRSIRARKFNNQAGAAGPADFRFYKSRCCKPFREIAIKHDGEIVLCCNDWRRYFRLGNLTDVHMGKLWNHPAMRAARKVLFHEGRNFSICYGCNSYAYRVGLLPDLSAKHTMGKPSENDRRLIKEIVKKGSDLENVYVDSFRDIGMRKVMK